MKIFTISRAEMQKMNNTYSWIGDPSFQNYVRQQLVAAGFDLTQIVYGDRDKDGNRVYAQKEHEEEDIETAFQGHS